MDEALRLLATVDGLSAVELNYPQHVTLDDVGAIATATALGLTVSALNMRYDPPRFVSGALSAPDPRVRGEAVAMTVDAVELAVRHGIPHVIVWPGPDGVDLPFQADYSALWGWTVDGLRTIARHDPDVRVSVEYKPWEPRRIAVVATMAEALLCAADTEEDNVGVTLDVCHALMAGETPAKAAELALARGKLFGVHLNDGYGQADDGLMVGSVHLPQLRELLWSLERHRWRGTFYFDTFPTGLDPVAEAEANIGTVERELAIVARLMETVLAPNGQSGTDPIAVQRATLEVGGQGV